LTGREVSCFAYDPERNVDPLGFYLKPVGEDVTMHLHLLWMSPEDIGQLVNQETERLRTELGGVVAA
jgi:hypothetical protein